MTWSYIPNIDRGPYAVYGHGILGVCRFEWCLVVCLIDLLGVPGKWGYTVRNVVGRI
jgi:hypothetical protein